MVGEEDSFSQTTTETERLSIIATNVAGVSGISSQPREESKKARAKLSTADKVDGMGSVISKFIETSKTAMTGGSGKGIDDG